MKKICFISFEAYALFNKASNVTVGGAGVQLYLLANELSKDPGYNISFIVGDFGQPDIEEFDNIKVFKARKGFKKRLPALSGIVECLSLFLLLRKIDADIYHQRAAGYQTGIIAFFCHFFKKKFIYATASSTDVDLGFKKKDPSAHLLYGYGLKKADIVLAQNEEHRLLLKQNYNKESVLLKNSFTIPSKEKILDFNKREFILWVGTSRKLKQPFIFIRLAKIFPNKSFVMIMPKHGEDDELFKNVSRKVVELKNLKFIEKVPFDEIGDYFRKAILFINTSVHEGFPNTFVQSCSFATPVISLNVNPDQFITKYHCGFFSEGDEAQLEKQLDKLTQNDNLWKTMSRNSYGYVQKEHDIKANLEAYKNFLNEKIMK